MSDQSVSGHHRHRTPKAEYATYFWLILAFALPVQALAWAWAAIRDRQIPTVGPLARALRDAEEITPAIFRP